MLRANILKKEIVDRLQALGMLIGKSNSAMLAIYQSLQEWKIQ